MVFLSGCSASYNDLSSAFGTAKNSTGSPLPADSKQQNRSGMVLD
jgi:hypothetical protein